MVCMCEGILGKIDFLSPIFVPCKLFTLFIAVFSDYYWCIRVIFIAYLVWWQLFFISFMVHMCDDILGKIDFITPFFVEGGS